MGRGPVRTTIRMVGRTAPMIRPHDRYDVELRFQYHPISGNDTPILADQTSDQPGAIVTSKPVTSPAEDRP
jgi:hypothetical protein